MGAKFAPRNNYPGAAMRAITASANVLDPRPKSLYIDTTGTIVITNEDGTTSGTMNVYAGSELHVSPWKITTITSAVVIGIFD